MYLVNNVLENQILAVPLLKYYFSLSPLSCKEGLQGNMWYIYYTKF